jgi:trimethylamine--corrinoid protein Co-methyltransferase
MLIPFRLYQHVENLAFSIDGPPQIDHAAINLEIDLVQMPGRVRHWSALAQVRCDQGPNLITQASGMQASLMVCALECYVIDDDMLRGILRFVRGLETDEDSMVADVIDHAVRGEGHFLGEAYTFARMEVDFQYPRIADRTSPEEWEAAGSIEMRERARGRTREILDTHYPDHLNSDMDRALRDRFDIHLPRDAMSSPKGNTL